MTPDHFSIQRHLPAHLVGQFHLKTENIGAPELLPLLKEFLQTSSHHLDDLFKSGHAIRELVAARAYCVDQVLNALWSSLDWPAEAKTTLVAVGGYGRAELFPHTDIDVLVLVESDETMEMARQPLERFVASLWDLKLDVGHSVRTLGDCSEQARTDITIATNLIETRRLAGNELLFELLRVQAFSDEVCSEKAFFQAKVDEQAERHQRYSESEYNLEPNIKTCPGALRDIQTIGWIARRHAGPEATQEERFAILTDEESRILDEGEEYLWTLRYGLQMLAGRNENRLLFDHQRGLAKLLGYEDTDESLAIESLMKRYYRFAMTLGEINDVLIQHFSEEILGPGPESEPETINRRFRIRDNYLEVTDPQIFAQSPYALTEVFVLLAQRPEIKGIRAGTIRNIRAHLHLIDHRFRNSLANTSLFMEILRTPHALHETLSAMRKYGFLARYLPEFGNIIGQMQHDLFHIYTVDAHTLRVVRNMIQLANAESAESYPLAHWLIQRLPKIELLYIAGLYHDIAKGRGGDHSELGAVDAEAFCRRHHLSQRDTSLVCWLVENHLLMSMTAQRKDPSDPDVIQLFAGRMHSQTHLDFLYVLTVCDISATNPTLWNNWRAALLRQLYTETVRYMRRSTGRPLKRSDWVLATQAEVKDMLRQQRQTASPATYTDEDIDSICSAMEDSFFMQDSTADIAWQIHTILNHRRLSDTPLVKVKEAKDGGAEGFFKVFVYTGVRDDLFAVSTATLEVLNLNIVEARLHSVGDNTKLIQFVVSGTNGEFPQKNRIVSALTDALEKKSGTEQVVSRRIPRQLKFFRFPTEVTISSDTTHERTIVEVVTPDRPGLLARLARIFQSENIRLHSARIVTLGERVEDVFMVTSADGKVLTEAESCRALQESISQQLDEDNRQDAPQHADQSPNLNDRSQPLR